MDKPLILLTNDDGFFSEGLEALRSKLENYGSVFIVAPDRERSATSLSLTLHNPLRLKQIKKNVFSLSGTPVDCVYMAVQKILPRTPDILISGINPGPNLGQQDIAYSGTMGGALQGTFLGIPSFAISMMHDKDGRFEFEHGAEFASRLASKILKKGLPDGVTLNVNIPPPPIKGTRLTKLGEKRYNPEILEKKDPRNRTYYWIGTGRPKTIGDEESDVMVIKKGFITITPVQRDMTHHSLLNSDEMAGYLDLEDYENI
ncbi:5'/3'-nucleotidase SurE [Acidobacteriota bacterium]